MNRGDKKICGGQTMNTLIRTIVVTGLACALGSGAALAGKPDKPTNPPADSGRDVIGQADYLCTGDVTGVIETACEIQFRANGGLLEGNGCDGGDGLIAWTDSNGLPVYDTGDIDYTGRNCDTNEAAMVKLASSAILSLDDLITREKEQQRATAAGYLCSFQDKWMALDGADKLIPGKEKDEWNNPTDIDVDLGADASELADAVMGGSGYCDSLGTL
jgi:hypothetical protein